MAIDGGIVPLRWLLERLSTARLSKYCSSFGIGPVSELFERSSDCKFVQFEMYGEIVPRKVRFGNDSLYILPLLHVAPARFDKKPEHGLAKVGLVQLMRLWFGS